VIVFQKAATSTCASGVRRCATNQVTHHCLRAQSLRWQFAYLHASRLRRSQCKGMPVASTRLVVQKCPRNLLAVEATEICMYLQTSQSYPERPSRCNNLGIE